MGAHAVQGLAVAAAHMVEVAFALEGDTVPPRHRFALSEALRRALPWLAEPPGAGVHRLNLVRCGEGTLRVSPRTRLVLRVPRAHAAATLALGGAELAVGGTRLRAVRPVVRELLAYGTLYAPLVVADGPDEAVFVAGLRTALDALGVRADPVCGRWQSVEDGQLVGCSVMLSGLDAAQSQRVLQEGIGPHRLLGCGLFIPHKSAAAVGMPD